MDIQTCTMQLESCESSFVLALFLSHLPLWVPLSFRLCLFPLCYLPIVCVSRDILSIYLSVYQLSLNVTN